MKHVFPCLDSEQKTAELLLAAQTADEVERAHIENHVVTQYLGLARALANRFTGRGPERDDLDQVAFLGLVKAVRRYDPERGSFSAFATPTILGELKRYFRDRGWMVRPPRWIQELQAEIRQTVDAQPDHARPESDRDIAKLLEIKPSRVREARAASGCFTARSIDVKATADARPLSETLANEDNEYEMVDELASLAPACKQLSPEDRELLHLRFFEDLTQQEIADRLDISQMQVSRRLKRLLEQLRREMADQPAAA